MTTVNRQRLNLQAPEGAKLVLTQLETGSTLTAEGTMIMTLPALKLVSGSDTVGNVAQSINLLQSNLTTEINNRVAGDGNLTILIDAEASNRDNAITAEATLRSTADSTLQTNINQEAIARAAADTALQGNIDALTVTHNQDSTNFANALADEIAARIAGDTSEASQRASADTTLQGHIDTEISNREAAIITVTDKINDEKARIDAILSFSTAELDSLREISDAYQTADSSLLNMITTLTTDFNNLKAVVDALATNV